MAEVDRSSHQRRSLGLRTPACLAALWALAFAAASAYWAAGGTGGANTIARSLADRAAERHPEFVATLWAAVAAKAMLTALALALVRPATARFARAVRFAGWIAGGALTLYGATGLIEFCLMALGARDVPADVGDAAVLWYVLLWEPLWLLGGLLFLAATWQAARMTSDQRAMT
jgi:hypothetical protein